MKPKNNCLYCYKALTNETDFHEKCALEFFGTKEAPKIPYSLEDMGTLAKNVVERSIAVPGVQPKLSMSLDKDSETKENPRLTVVGALGGQTNDGPGTPFAFANRNTLTGETDVNLYNATVPTNGINMFGFTATGHMIPVFAAVGNDIDLVAYQGYNLGASTNRTLMYDAFAYYAEIHGFKVAAGVHYPDEPWGPYYTYTHNNVASLSAHIRNHPDRIGDGDGTMIWQLLMTRLTKVLTSFPALQKESDPFSWLRT